jgi:acyl-CoA thioesterase I
MKSALILVCLAVSILFGQFASSSPLKPGEMKRILVLGDSLSGGFGIKPSEAYPALLANKLRAAGLNFQVTNASQTGGTTDGGLERLPGHLKGKIDIFILELGINDAFRGVPVDQIQSNLQQIIDKVKARNPGVRVVIAGMAAPRAVGTDDYVSAFGKTFAELATRNGAVLVPYLLEGVAGDPSLNLPDGIHPNAAGQRVLAENVWRVLEALARETAAEPASHVRLKRQWTLHDQTIPIRVIRLIRNGPITRSWKPSKSQPKAKIAMNACASCAPS